MILSRFGTPSPRYGGHLLLTVKREQDEKPVRNESDLWYRLRNKLRAEGEDVIKKEMSKDGHMVSDGIYYLRSRKHGPAGSFMIYDSQYAVRDAAADFNGGKVELDLIIEGEPGAVDDRMARRAKYGPHVRRQDWSPEVE